MKKLLIIAALILSSSQALAKSWQIDNAKSKIEFVTAQDSTIITGNFNKFSGEINFDKANLKTSNVGIYIDLNSFSTSLSNANNTLKERNWFNIKQYPNAGFRSTKITQNADNKFRMEGVLKLKGVQLPVNIDFSFQQYSDNKAVAVGETKINRLNFGIGQKNENGVQDLVTVKFVIVANVLKAAN